jgi:hypothetical protein
MRGGVGTTGDARALALGGELGLVCVVVGAVAVPLPVVGPRRRADVTLDAGAPLPVAALDPGRGIAAGRRPRAAAVVVVVLVGVGGRAVAPRRGRARNPHPVIAAAAVTAAAGAALEDPNAHPSVKFWKAQSVLQHKYAYTVIYREDRSRDQND